MREMKKSREIYMMSDFNTIFVLAQSNNGHFPQFTTNKYNEVRCTRPCTLCPLFR
jgi:hypothetical protein